MFTSTGSPVQPFVDALRQALRADAAFMAMVTGLYGDLPASARTAYPYVVLGQRSRQNDSGAMGVAGGHVTVQLDCWSAHRGASEVHAILSRIAVVLERAPLRVSGFDLLHGSLTCELEDVTDEPDPDMPEKRLYHGLQRWTAEIHESQ